MLYFCKCSNEFFLTKGETDIEKTDYYGTCKKCGASITKLVYHKTGKVVEHYHPLIQEEVDNQARSEKEQ